MAGHELWEQAGADLYQVLRLSPDADQAAIQEAWHSAAKKTHPDRGGDESRFKAVSVAYLVLSDPVERARYDRTRGWPTEQRDHVQPAPPDPIRPQQRSSFEPSRRVVWLAVLAGIVAVVLSYLWPVFTIVAGCVVAAFVTTRYIRRARARNPSRWP